jgi:hypothetical protein
MPEGYPKVNHNVLHGPQRYLNIAAFFNVDDRSQNLVEEAPRISWRRCKAVHSSDFLELKQKKAAGLKRGPSRTNLPLVNNPSSEVIRHIVCADIYWDSRLL